MKISKFIDYINENYEHECHFYAFDWDDNILHMPTVIHMEKLIGDEWVPTDVSTSQFAIVRNDSENWRLIDGDPGKAFSEFRDFGPRGDSAFLEDVKSALSRGDYGPVWDDFIRCLSEGAIFSIITARGHEPESIRGAIEWIIDNELSEDLGFEMYANCLKFAYLFSHGETFDRIPRGKLSKTPLIEVYLDNCRFYGVSSNSFAKEFGEASASNPEHAKQMALDKFIEESNKRGLSIGAKSVSVGFSDDDPKNVEHVRKYFKEKSALTNDLMPHKVKLNLYKTTDRALKGGERTKFHESSHIAPGMASSVMPFSQFNNMSDRMFTNNQEYDKSMRLGTGQLAKMSKDILKRPKRKVKSKNKNTKK
jgi:hypothetical protein